VRNEARLGMAGNWSATLDRAQSCYRALLMDDDLLLPGFLAATVGVLDADPTVGVAFTDHHFNVDGEMRPRECALPSGRHESCTAIILRHHPLVAVSAAVMRSEVWEQVRPLPDLLNADLVMHLRAAEAGWAFHYIDTPLMAYRVHAGQLTGREARFRGDLVQTWDLFEFDDPDCEALRRRFLADALIGRAATHLKAREADAARAAVRRARTLARHLGPRAALVAALANRPALAPVAAWGWRGVRHLRRNPWRPVPDRRRRMTRDRTGSAPRPRRDG
jgi:GT2 family glycosyltransferase